MWHNSEIGLKAEIQLGWQSPVVHLHRTTNLDCTVKVSNGNPKAKSASPGGEVTCKTIFKINNITAGKFDFELSRGSASQGEDINMKEKSN